MKDDSICRWSVRENNMCPYQEMLNIIVNDVSKKKSRCEGKECLKILLAMTDTKNELELIKKYAPQLLKPEGPAHTTDLLSNINIDSVIKDFSLASINKDTPFTNGPFYHVPFDMMDFMETRDSTLRTLDFNKLKELNFKTFGCVLNTDYWSGKGKHWVCIFGTINPNEISVEYFNSSGRKVDRFPGLHVWKESQKEQGHNVKIRNVVPGEGLQRNRTECGTWCICYIKCRLEGKSPDFFMKENIKDRDMIQARKILFSN